MATLLSFVLAMTMYPDVYAKAQEEMDRVVGVDRLPDFSDRESLPYLESVIREIYRQVRGTISRTTLHTNLF